MKTVLEFDIFEIPLAAVETSKFKPYNSEQKYRHSL